MKFSTAFERVRKGAAMRLPEWPSDEVVRAQLPDETHDIEAPYLYLQRGDYSVTEWKESYNELFSEDWETQD